MMKAIHHWKQRENSNLNLKIALIISGILYSIKPLKLLQVEIRLQLWGVDDKAFIYSPSFSIDD